MFLKGKFQVSSSGLTSEAVTNTLLGFQSVLIGGLHCGTFLSQLVSSVTPDKIRNNPPQGTEITPNDFFQNNVPKKAEKH